MLDPRKNAPAKYLLTARDNRGKPGEFDYYVSDEGMVFLSPVPDNLSDYYDGGYGRVPANETELAEVARRESFKIEPLKALVPEGDYLEIGPWIGMASYSALKAGYDVSVIEINQDCVDLLSSVGITAYRSGDPAATIRQNGLTYDVIAMWHSIEHVPHPWQLLDAAAAALKPGGVLLVAAPNPESAQFRAHRERWYHLDAPRHVYFMPMSMVIEIGRNNGLELVEVTTDDKVNLREDLVGWAYPALGRFAVPRVMKVVGKFVGPFLSRRHRTPGEHDGAGFTIIMRKPAA